MILVGQKASYEIIQILPEAYGNLYYRGHTDTDCFLTGVPLGERILSLVSEWKENPAFTDFEDYLIRDDRIFLVFSDVQGIPLAEALESMDRVQRFSVGRQVMERFLIQELPVGLQCELAENGDIYVKLTKDAEPEICFAYRLRQVEKYDGLSEVDGVDSLLELLELLLLEKNGESCPEVAGFLEGDRERGEKNLMDIYKEYLMLLPFLDQKNPEEEAAKKQALPERMAELWKTWSKKLLGALKIGMGLLTMCAALILLPQVWQEKIKPVVDGAVLWKSVYVDGETLPGEGSAESESQEEPEDPGRQTLYWDNGAIRYQGGVQDEKYNGSGTLYYKSGGIEYQGEFAFGKKEGTGISYLENGQIWYEGGFHNDRFEGDGRLYDTEHGSLLYEGGFQGGKYSGEGTLYQALSDFPRYVGGFRLGYFDGAGVEYDESGCMKYEGDFLLGVYHGNGKMYDSEYGNVFFEGAFRNGMPVLPEDQPSEDQPSEEQPLEEQPSEEQPLEEQPPEESEQAGELPGEEPEEDQESGGGVPEEAAKAEDQAESVSPSLSPVIGPVYRHKK